MGLGEFVIELRACCLAMQLVIWDFSLIIPYGVRVMGFFCDWLGLRVAQSIGSGLRVFQSSGSGLRVRSPDGHMMLLIPLYLTGVFSLFPFPHPLFPSLHWLLIYPPTSSTQNDYPLCSICWWYDGRTSPPQPASPIGRFLSFDLFGKSYWWNLFRTSLAIRLSVILPPWWEGWWNQSRDRQSSTPGLGLEGKVSKVGCFGSHLWPLY